MSNTLRATGPSFKQRAVSNAPTGNVDVTPTVLALLGQPVPSHMDGRVLDEAILGGPDHMEMVTESNEIIGTAFESGDGSDTSVHYIAKTVETAGHTYMESAGLASDRTDLC